MTGDLPPVWPMQGLEDVRYLPGPAVLIFSDSAERRDWIAAFVTAAGGRVSVALPLADAVGRIDDHAAPDGVVVDFAASVTGLAEAILETMEQGARAQRFRSIALIGASQIDLAAARAGHSDVQLICAPDDRGMGAAVSAMMAPPAIELNDVSADTALARLGALSEEVGRVAHMLAALSQSGQRPDQSPDGQAAPAIDAPAIRGMIRARRMREQFFPAELFADPAWDMLLDLCAAKLEGQPVAVSSLCIAAAVPPTTALRWIKTLTDLGMFRRVADSADRRRVFIELSPEVAAAMQACLAAIRDAGV